MGGGPFHYFVSSSIESNCLGSGPIVCELLLSSLVRPLVSETSSHAAWPGLGWDGGMANVSRIEDSKAFKKIEFAFGGYKLRYAWVSQRGYYPEDLDKANQDAHAEYDEFGKAEGITDCAFFGVFDGHGKMGDKCAQFARDHIPRLLEKEIAKVRASQRHRSQQSHGHPSTSELRSS